MLGHISMKRRSVLYSLNSMSTSYHYDTIDTCVLITFVDTSIMITVCRCYNIIIRQSKKTGFAYTQYLIFQGFRGYGNLHMDPHTHGNGMGIGI